MKPLTRKEMLLDGAAKGNLDTFKPATREEVFAKRALANAGGSGGGALVVLTWDDEKGTYISSMSANEIGELIYSGVNVNVVDNWGEWMPFSDVVKYEFGGYGITIHKLKWDYGNFYGYAKISFSLDDTITQCTIGGITMLAMTSIDNKPYAVGIDRNGELVTQEKP